MVAPFRPGFARQDLKARYDVLEFEEDDWHTYTAKRTSRLIVSELGRCESIKRLLNAGSGIYSIDNPEREIRVDLFDQPLSDSRNAVCADIQALPFRSEAFDVVICVGEVLGYCDPAISISELSRVLASGGLLICDFESSRSLKYWGRPQSARAADIVISDYNGMPERTWIYDPLYIGSLLTEQGLKIRASYGTHGLSSLARRAGLRAQAGLWLQRKFEWLPLPAAWAELMTLVCEKAQSC